MAPGIGAILVLGASLFLSKFVLDLIVGFDWPVAVYVAVLVAAGYGPSVAWWWYATGRWGSGDRRGDVGARLRWSDLGSGPAPRSASKNSSSADNPDGIPGGPIGLPIRLGRNENARS